MFFFSPTDPVAWGADLRVPPYSPLMSTGRTVFLVPVRQWSDGTADR